MYNNFYGFDKNPFNLNPDADFLFLREKHNTIISSLKNGLSKQFGMMVVTGDMGTGKSILAQSLLNQLDQQYTAALLPTTQYDTLEEMLKNIFIAFGIKNHINNSTELSNLLFENFLTSEFWSEKKVLLIIDDAQNLSVDLLENIRLLSNFTINNKQIIQFILVGQKSLIDSLKIPELGQLIKSVSLFEELPPLNLTETHAYIHHRIKNAGGNENEPYFTKNAYDSIYELSSGIPSLINHICELSFISAFSEKIKPIDSELIKAVVNGKNNAAIPTEEHSQIDIDQNTEIPEQILITNKITTPEAQNESSLTQSSSNESSSIIEEFASTIITEDLEEIEDLIDDAEGIEPLKTDVPLETKSVNFATNSDAADLTDDNSKIKQNTAKQIKSKIPNKWLITTLALLIIANTTLYLYSKKGEQQVEDALTNSQTSDSAAKPNLAEFNKQLVNAKPSDSSSPLNTKQSIDSQTIKDLAGTNIESLSSAAILPQETKDKDAVNKELKPSALALGFQKDPLNTDVSKNSEKNNSSQKIEKPKTTEQLVKQSKQIKRLLRRAKRQFAQMYLTTPRRYNALDTYKQILELDPKYEPALDGLKNIKNLYIFWAERDIKKRRFRQAERFITKALLAAPEDAQLITLQNTIEQQKLPRN